MRCSWLAWEAKASKLVLPASASSSRPSSSKTRHNKFCRCHFKSRAQAVGGDLADDRLRQRVLLLKQISFTQQETAVHRLRVARSALDGGLEHAAGLGQKSDHVRPVGQSGQRPRLEESGAQGQGRIGGKFWSKLAQRSMALV